MWTTNSRINANAEVPAQAQCGDQCPPEGKVLHVHVDENDFTMVRKSGSTTLTEQHIQEGCTEVASPRSSFVGIRISRRPCRTFGSTGDRPERRM